MTDARTGVSLQHRVAGSGVAWRRVAVAPLFDALCLCLFVLLGRESHGSDAGSG
jgi:hypothetical protein